MSYVHTIRSSQNFTSTQRAFCVLRSVVNIHRATSERARARTHTPYSSFPLIRFSVHIWPSEHVSFRLFAQHLDDFVWVCVCVFVWRICVRIECFDHINLHRFTYYLALKSLLLFAHDENSRPNGQTTRVFVCACIITISFYLRKQSRSTSAVMRCALFTLPKGQSTLTHTHRRDVASDENAPNDTCLRQRVAIHPNYWCRHCRGGDAPVHRTEIPNHRQQEHIWIIEITLRYTSAKMRHPTLTRTRCDAAKHVACITVSPASRTRTEIHM